MKAPPALVLGIIIVVGAGLVFTHLDMIGQEAKVRPLAPRELGRQEVGWRLTAQRQIQILQ